MTRDDMETVYERLAVTLDAVAPAQRELYLAKLALALCDELGDVTPCLDVIEECRTGIAETTPS